MMIWNMISALPDIDYVETNVLNNVNCDNDINSDVSSTALIDSNDSNIEK